MRLRETLNLPLSARDVPAMYADGDYTAIRRDVLRASSAESTVEGGSSGAFTVRTELALPTDRVPDIVRPFVGSSVTVREQQSWSVPATSSASSPRRLPSSSGTEVGRAHV